MHGRSEEDLRRHHAAISYLAPDLLYYYLPAFMTAVLDSPREAAVLHDSLEFLFSTPSERRDELLHRLTSAQHAAVRAYLEFCIRYAEFPMTIRDAIAHLDATPPRR